jgi:hypothetical protein
MTGSVAGHDGDGISVTLSAGWYKFLAAGENRLDGRN